MSNVPHLPVLRLGRSYESLDKLEIKDHRTGEIGRASCRERV